MRYVDGYVLPVPVKFLPEYRKMAKKAGKIWIEHGALQFMECAGEDLKIKKFFQFPAMAKVKKGETVVFSFIVFKSRAQRDKVNAKVMKDPRLLKMMANAKDMPLDMARMAYGGFTVMVDE